MELKFLLFTFIVFFAVFGCIETRRSSGGSRSRGSSSRGSSHSSSGHSSSGHSWGGSSSHGSGSRGTSSSHHTGSFLNAERGHTTSTGNRPSSNNHGSIKPFAPVPPPPSRPSGNNNHSPFKPFAPVPPAPSRPSGHNNNNLSPNRPFATVPPPIRNTGHNNNNLSPNRPFATVPPPIRNTGHNNNNLSPNRPFATVPPPIRNTGAAKPAPPPPGFVLPHSNTHSVKPPVGAPHTGHPPPVLPPKHGSNFGRNNGSGSFSPPGPGFNIPSQNRPGSNPSAPIQPSTYPTQGTHPGSGTNYPKQPPYNPAFPHPGNHQAPGPGFVVPGTNTRPIGSNIPPVPLQPTHYPGQGSNPILGPNYPRQPPFNPSVHNPAPPFYSPYPTQQHGYNVHPAQPQVVPQYVHTLPPNPSHTVVVVPGQSGGGYHRSTGDIFKEALIHAGVNAAVHRITSPGHYNNGYYPNNNWNSNSQPPQGHSTVTTTNTHIVNNNYYDQNGNPVPAPGNNYPQNYPVGGTQGGSTNGFNTQGNNPVNYPNSGNQGSYPISGNQGSYPNSAGFPVSQGTVGSQVPTNGQSYPSQQNGNGQANNNGYVPIWDYELMNITEKLFSLDENNAGKFITLNLQKQIEANNTNITDQSPLPLFSVQPAAYNIPTIRAIRSLYKASFEIQNKTRKHSRKEEALFVDLMLNTNVMTAAMDFLARKNLIKNDYYEHKDMLKDLWFTPYDGFSSGFKRIFQGELYEGIFWGIQDWVAFDFQEQTGKANYFSYVNKTDLGKSSPNTAILKTNFQVDGNMKAGTALFVGISPELQMALYTICYHVRRDNYCDISLGGTQFKIYTHADRYFGSDLINVAFPIL